MKNRNPPKNLTGLGRGASAKHNLVRAENSSRTAVAAAAHSDPVDPFAAPLLKSQIIADLSRVEAKWQDWLAEPEGSYADRLVQHLVNALDVHGKWYLEAVQSAERISTYLTLLRHVGTALLENAERRGPLQRRYDDDHLRQIVESSFEFMEKKQRLSAEQQKEELQKSVERARVELRERSEAYDDRRRDMLLRIATRFEARYQHWKAEAIARTTVGGKKRRGSHATPVAEIWAEIRIEFLSDERVQVWQGTDTSTLNYQEMGFADQRDGKPSGGWLILRAFAQASGVISKPPSSTPTWSAVEKGVERIRKQLRIHFQIHGDPIPFKKNQGYRTLFQIGCAPSFQT